jgi:hypothetical protein
MMTFLPYPDFRQSLEALDMKRLGNQRRESKLCHLTLQGEDSRWKWHPCVKMWRGYEDALAEYYNLNIDVWMARGYKNTMEKIPHAPVRYPHWLGDAEFHARQRAALLEKNPEWYGRFGWKEIPKIDYIWPAGLDRLRNRAYPASDL